MASAIEDYIQYHIQQVITLANTQEDATNVIFGSKTDFQNLPLSWLIKAESLLLHKFQVIHCQDIWLGTRKWVPIHFHEEISTKQYMLSQIKAEVESRVQTSNDTTFKLYENKSQMEIILTWNRLNPNDPKTLGQPFWEDEATPPISMRTIMDPAFAPTIVPPIAGAPQIPDFDIQEPNTWDQLNDVDFNRAIALYGWWPEHIRTRGYIYESINRRSRYSHKSALALTSANTYDEIHAIAILYNAYA